ncbi:MAG: S26 family signal peptidase, partial [Planctomycetota bacterium]
MSKKKKRQPFQAEKFPSKESSISNIDTNRGLFGFMRDYGVRETFESIAVAVMLALLFRTYEAEAFIIPTGSMAPTLQGQHMDVVCEQCGYQYRAGASYSSS